MKFPDGAMGHQYGEAGRMIYELLCKFKHSAMLESVVTTLLGFVAAMLVTAYLLPLFGFTPTVGENLAINLIYTAVHFIRAYIVRIGFARWQNSAK